MKLLINNIQIDWQSEQSHYFFNPQHPKADDFKKIALKVPVLKSHIYLYTSGGSKICLLSKRAFLHSALTANQNLQANSKDKWLISLPFYHVSGISVLARAFLSGSSYSIQDGGWNPISFKNQIKTEKITLSALVPTQVYDLAKEDLKAPSSLKALLVGGDYLSPLLYKKSRDLGWPLLPCYGATETCSHIAVACLDSLKKKSKPLMKLLEGIEVFPYQKEENKKTKSQKTKAQKLKTGFFKVKTQSLLTAYFDLKSEKLFDPKDKEGRFFLEDRLSLKNNILKVSQISYSQRFHQFLENWNPDIFKEFNRRRNEGIDRDDVSRDLGKGNIKILSPSNQIKILGEKVNLESLVFELEKSFNKLKMKSNLLKKPYKKKLRQKNFKAYLIPVPEERQGWSLILVGEIKNFEMLFRMLEYYNRQVPAYERIEVLYFLDENPLQKFLKIKADNILTTLGFI